MKLSSPSSPRLFVTGQDRKSSTMPLLELNILLSSLPQRLQQSPLLLHIPDIPFLSQYAMQPSHVVSLSLLHQFTSEKRQESPQPLRRPLLSSSVLGSPNALVSPDESSWKCFQFPLMDLQHDCSSLLGKSCENYFTCRFNWLHLNFVFSPIRRQAICSSTPPSPFKWVSRELFVFCY